jgi:hypothetical protein
MSSLPRATTPLTRTPGPSAITPTPSPSLDTPAPSAITPTPVIPRVRNVATVGDTPQTRAEPTTAEIGHPIDETAPVPDHLLEIESGPIDLDSGPVDAGSYLDDLDADPDELVPLRPDLLSLQVAVYEDATHLPTVQGAIVAAGHVVQLGASQRDGTGRIVHAIRGGGIDAVIAALPGGEPVIAAALALEPRRPVVIVSLTAPAVDAIERAHAAGADLVATRPHDVDRLAPVLFAASRLLVEKRVALTARGAEAVLRARLDEIADHEPGGLMPFEMFQRVLELEMKRAKRYEYPLSVALFAVEVAPPPPPPGIRGILRARAGTALIHTIRDIDIATQLDHERFLVLLPYTDLKGSAGLARRVIASVAALDPVVAGGRAFPPRVVGAVAGALPGQPLSFAKLMKDATRALEQARRDGAELAVQP